MNYKELICLQRTKELVLTTQKREVVRMEKRFRSLLAKKISCENLFTFPSRIQLIMQTHRGSFSNSFSTCIGQQIHRCRQQHISLGRIQHSSVVLEHLVDKSRQHKFTDIANSIFRLERYSTVAKLSEGSTPYSLFFINCREQQGLKTSTSWEHLQDYKNDVFSILWFQPKKKGYTLSRQCQFQKIPSLPSGGDNYKSPR